MATKKINTVIRKPSGLKKDGTPNSSWLAFIKRMDLFQSLPIDQWTQDQVLGYLLSLYEKQYGFKWSLSYSGAPTKCSEIYCLQRTYNNLGTASHAMVKQYIDWVFETKIAPQKLSVKSLGFFFTKKICEEFKLNASKITKITKSKELPVNYIDKAGEFGLTLNTYGDLAFAKMALDQVSDDIPEEYVPYKNLFDWLTRTGFKQELLERLE